MDILTNLYFWLFIIGLLGTIFSPRLIRHYREEAAFSDEPERNKRRARLAVLLMLVFVLAMLGGLYIFGGQVANRFGLLERFNLEGLAFLNPGDSVNGDGTQSETDGQEGPATITLTPTISPTPTITPTPTVTPTPTNSPTPTATPTTDLNNIVRIGNTSFQGVNVRAAPSVGAEIVEKLRSGTEVILLYNEVEAEEFTWRKVQLLDGRQGWVVADYIVIP